MTLVVDASVAVPWLFKLDASAQADALLQSGERLIAPDLIFAEISNAAWKAVTFGQTPRDGARGAVLEAARLFDEIVPSVELKDRALEIALQLRHPAYDCFYLALADQRRCQLVTADDRLIARCARTPLAHLVRPLFTAP